MRNSCTEKCVQLCAKVGFLPQIFTLALVPSQSLYVASCQKDHVEGSPLVPKHVSETEYFTNSQREDVGTGFIKQINMLTPERIHGPSPRCSQLVSAFRLGLTELILPEPCYTIHPFSFGLHSYPRMGAIRH